QSSFPPMLAFGMPTAFTRDDVAKIAALANLELDAEEIDVFARQIGDILAYADQVQQIDTAGVPPTATVVTRHAPERPDQPIPSLDRDAAWANAPGAARGAGLFRVPRVL